MKTKRNVTKQLMLFVTALAFCISLFAKPVDVKAAIAAPTNVRQTNYTHNAVQVQWSEVIGATKFEYSYSTNPSAEGTPITVYTLGANIYNLTPGTTYYIKVRACVGSTPGTWSSVVAVDTAPNPTATITQTAVNDNNFSVAWNAVAGATGYDVCYGLKSDASDAKTYRMVASNVTSINISGLPKNSAYYVFVFPYRNAAKAENLCYGDSKGLVCVTKPSTPKSVQILARSFKGASSGNLTISPKTTYFTWEPTSSAVNTDGYEVQIFNSKGKKMKTLKVNGYTALAKWTSSKAFTQAFQYRVRSYVAVNGKKYYSNWSSKKTYVPAAVINKITTYGRYPSTGKLTWKKVSGAKTYTVYHKTSANGKWKAVAKNVKGTSANVKYNAYGQNYYYVRANKVKVGKKNYNSTTKDFDAYVMKRY